MRLQPSFGIRSTGGCRRHYQPNRVASSSYPKGSKCVTSVQLLNLILTIAMIQLVSQPPCKYLTLAQDGLRKSSMPGPVPRKFSDTYLPAIPPEGSEVVEHLGRISYLNTFLPPKTDVVVASFNLYNRRKIMKRVKFQPNTYSALVKFDEKVGPYEFNLDHLMQSAFVASSKTVIMIPGYMSVEDEPWITEARKAWLDIEDVNVIEVSWTLSNKCIYSQAVARTPIVARQIVILLHYLAELSQTDLHDERFLMNIHLVGHSLGAHISGFVGRDLAGLVGRITGLDPAGPSFDMFNQNERLDKSNAKLVEVIHTNSGKMHYAYAAAGGVAKILSKVGVLNSLGQAVFASYNGEGDTSWFGIDLQLGHIDYYANNGQIQPGCNDIFRICDHGRATEIYVRMLQSERLFRSWTEDKKLLKERRLLAFPANDYYSFMRGNNFHENCPFMMDIEKHLTPVVAEQFKRCSVPIDMITPTEELIEELKNDYNIDFNSSSTDSQRYYFNTLDKDENLIGDQYLLKIYSDYVYFDESCSFDIGLQFRGEMKLKRLDLDGVSGIRKIANLTFAIPFVYSADEEQRQALVELLSELNQDPDATVDESRVRKLLPENVTISLKKSKSKSIFGSVAKGLSNMIGMSSAPTCEASIGSIEIHPIHGYGRNFAGIYKHDSFKEDFVLANSKELAGYITNQFDNDYEQVGILNPKTEPNEYTRVVLRGVAFG